MTFTCIATTVPNLFTPPSIEWRYGENLVPLIGNPQMNSTTGELIFSDIRDENSGLYTCRASITVSKSGIIEFYNETSISISTSCKLLRSIYIQ